MKFDVVFVSYNSSEWLEKNVESILRSNYNLKNLSLLYCDNNSTDNSVEIIKKIQKKYRSKFNKIELVEAKSNKGFGYGNNLAAKLGDSPYVFIFNIDTEVYEDTFTKLEESIKNSYKEFGMWELRQIPYEHPKYYNPVDGETSWASGACMILKRDLYEKIGGFDENIFMYCEDVEISWNVRKNGYKIKYLYDVPIIHYSYKSPKEFKYTQFVYGFISNWYVRAKYGKLKNFLRGTQYIYEAGYKGKYIPSDLSEKTIYKIKRLMRKSLHKNFFKYLYINLTTKKENFKPTFLFGLDYEIGKEYPFYQIPDVETDALVSVIVRTCNRPEALRECLISLRKQSYKNIEIVVVEDGKPEAEKMIKDEFNDLNIVYEALGKNYGRSHSANVGMAKAKGKYLNFLDDDDLFFPEHVETLVKELEINQWDIVYDGCFETKVEILSKKPYKYKIIEKGLWGSRRFSKKQLYRFNLFPIQTVMFKKELFYECGGIDEKIDALEDWDFWVRLSLKHAFHRVKSTSSIFRTPYNQKVKKEREEFLASTLEYLEEKFKEYIPECSVYDKYND